MRIWEPVARKLAAAGYATAIPDLSGTATAGPPYYRRQAQVIAECADSQPVILTGHSRAGPLLATAGTLLEGKVQGYVFVDARLPTPGRSWMGTAPPAVAAGLRGMADPGWPDAPGGYLQLSEPHEDEAARASELGWPVSQLLRHHLALLTEPARVAQAVRELISRL